MKPLKKYILLIIMLTTAVASCFAYEPPKMQCLKLMYNNQRIKMNWSSSPDCSHFRIYYFYVNGVLCDSLTVTTQNLCEYGGVDINNIPQSDNNEYYCYIVAVDSAGNAFHSDTIQSISLTVTPQSNNTMAFLEWESPSSNLDASWGDHFEIFKKRGFEADFPPYPFATVPNTQTSYTDTSDVCDNTISYQVNIYNHYSPNEQCQFMTTISTVHLVDSTSPRTPILDSVSVTPSNKVMLGFHAPEPYMQAYIIYYVGDNNNTFPLDTIYGQTFWIDPVIDPRYDARNYRIAVMDSCGNVSAMTNDPQCNMGLYINNTDACHKTTSIRWSTYANLINGINHYEVLLSSDMGQSWQVVGNATSNEFLIENLELNHEYMAFVRVVNNGGMVTASSNRVNIMITAEESSDFSYIRSVSVIDNGYIQIKVLTSGDTLPFNSITLQRSEDGFTFENFRTRNYNPNTADYVFNDSTADFTRNTYYYRTFLVNHCGTEVAQSNVSHNILLLGENNAQNNVLTWHGYDNWAGNVANYFIIRSVEGEDVFNNIASVPHSVMNSYADDISSLYETGSKFTYYIEAHEGLNSYGFEEMSISNQITLIQPPTLYVPNAFRPLAGNNTVFKPVNSFVSLDGYCFTVFTRTGECIFLTTNPQEGWDGCIKGKIAPMNVYVWHIDYKLPDGTPVELVGTVTLVK